jgi:hypothetical protein
MVDKQLTTGSVALNVLPNNSASTIVKLNPKRGGYETASLKENGGWHLLNPTKPKDKQELLKQRRK